MGLNPDDMRYAVHVFARSGRHRASINQTRSSQTREFRLF